VSPGAAADATQVGDVHLAQDAWISLIIRNGRLVPVRPDTVLRAGDEAVVLSAGPDASGLSTLFTERAEPDLHTGTTARPSRLHGRQV
jgi:potassium/hydrogen antiporter